MDPVSPLRVPPVEAHFLTFEPGRVIAGRYKLERPLARGGMGVVWIARHLLLDVPIAVKFVSPLLVTEADALRRFEREAKAAALLRSPHVVQILDYGIEDESPFFAMELLSGENLEERLRRAHSVDLLTAAKILAQTCKALELAAEVGIVHRDLKPANLFLARSGREEIVKVLDFGVAKGPWAVAGDTTQTGRLIGSVSYMSPEQARGGLPVDHRSDLWSLAVILYRMVVAEKPFEGSDVGDVVLKICVGEVPTPTDRRRDLPSALDAFFAKALARDANARFQSAAEMAAAFRALTVEVLGSAADIDGPLLFSDARPPAQRARIETDRPARADIGIAMPLRSDALNVDTLSVATSGAQPPRRSGGRAWTLTAVAVLLFGGISLAVWGARMRRSPEASALANAPLLAAARASASAVAPEPSASTVMNEPPRAPASSAPVATASARSAASSAAWSRPRDVNRRARPATVPGWAPPALER